MAEEAVLGRFFRDSPLLVGIFFSDVGGPRNAPCRIFCRRCLVSCVPYPSACFCMSFPMSGYDDGKFPKVVLPSNTTNITSIAISTGTVTNFGLGGVPLVTVGIASLTKPLPDHPIYRMFSNLSDALPQATAGTIRLLAVSSPKRMPQVPDVPTVSESGYPQFKTLTWNGLMAPAGTPKEIINKISAFVSREAKNPKFAKRLASFGADALGNSPEEFTAIIETDKSLWAEAVKVAGVSEK